MSLRMTAPTKHPKSGVYRVRVAIPARLRDTTARLYDRRAEFTESLNTREQAEARRRAPDALARIASKMAAAEAAFAGASGVPTEQQLAALGALWARRAEAALDGEARDAAEWDAALDALLVQVGDLDDEEDGDREVTPSGGDEAEAEALLAEHGLATDPATVTRAAKAVFQARWAFITRQRDKAAGALPGATNAASEGSPGPSPCCTFDALLTGWALDRGWRMDMKPIPGPLYERQRTLARFAAFVGHTDARAVTKADAVRFKQDMQQRGRHASTIRNDLSELSALWTHAGQNGQVPDADNPFRGILPPKAKRKRREPRAFTDAEAAAILTASRDQKGALRWLPWVLCLTGARLNEICQSVTSDVAAMDGISVIRLHDDGSDDGDGRTLKNEISRRSVPLHPSLVAEGFLDYVASLPTGSPLFPDLPVDATFGRRSVAGSKRLGRWLRSLGLTDPRLSPAHSWRHWLIDAARQAAIPTEIRSAITGHSAKADESAGYGAGMKAFAAVLAAHLAKVKPPIPALGPLPAGFDVAVGGSRKRLRRPRTIGDSGRPPKRRVIYSSVPPK